MTKNRLNGAELYKAMRLVDEHTDKLENGKLRYHDGWSDELIAKKVGVREDVVKYHRQKAIGLLERVGLKQKRSAGQNLRERVADLEARVAALEDAATKPVDIRAGRPVVPTLGFAHAKNGV